MNITSPVPPAVRAPITPPELLALLDERDALRRDVATLRAKEQVAQNLVDCARIQRDSAGCFCSSDEPGEVCMWCAHDSLIQQWDALSATAPRQGEGSQS